MKDGCGSGVTIVIGENPVICGPGLGVGGSDVPLMVCTGSGLTTVIRQSDPNSTPAPASQFWPAGYFAVGGRMSVQPSVGKSRSPPVGAICDVRTSSRRYGWSALPVARHTGRSASDVAAGEAVAVGVDVGDALGVGEGGGVMLGVEDGVTLGVGVLAGDGIAVADDVGPRLPG